MRQPQACSCSGASRRSAATPKAEASSAASPWLGPLPAGEEALRAPAHARPGTRSALPNSPPTEKPCSSRATSTSDRRDNADRRVARHHRHHQRADHHQQDRQRQRGLAAGAVAIGAEHDRAERPHQIRGAEGAEREQQRDGLVAGREEHFRDGDGEIAVDQDVVPFERVADRAGGDDAIEEFDEACGDAGVATLDTLIWVSLPLISSCFERARPARRRFCRPATRHALSPLGKTSSTPRRCVAPETAVEGRAQRAIRGNICLTAVFTPALPV